MTQPAWATSVWEYKITGADTPAIIDEEKTTAVVDTLNNEIRLPEFSPNSVAFWPDGSADYVVMSPTEIKHFSWNGSKMYENSILNVPGQNNPLAIAAPAPYSDVVVVDNTGAKRYSFTGTEMIENPALSVAGLSNVISVGARDNSIVGLVGSDIRAFTNGSRDVSLEPTKTLSNPIGLALYPDQNTMAVLENDRARFFMNTGTQMIENPTLAITGINDPKAISAGDKLNTVIIDGKEVKHYSFNGSSFKYNSVLSVTSGLSSPSCVALRPGSSDRIIIDGDKVKYYRFNDTSGQLVYDSNRSITIKDLSQLGGYTTSATVVSQVKKSDVDVVNLRIRAYQTLPLGTSITWSLTNNGTDFIKVWRVRNEGGTTYCEITTNNGSSWDSIGNATLSYPNVDTKELWFEFPSNQLVAWKAVLATSNPKVTPKICAPVPGDTAVIWEAGNPPTKPDLNIPANCYSTTTPTISWSFQDPDPGDTQSGYQVLIKKLDETLVHNSHFVSDANTEFKIPTSEAPEISGPLWQAGDYEFTMEVQIYDNIGISSGWSDPQRFCVVGLERPRVKELIRTSADQSKPIAEDITTHLVIKEGMPEKDLPITKAGGKVALLVDSIGPINSLEAIFPYLDLDATVHKIESEKILGERTNRWLIEFWTEASLEKEKCPDGTIVGMDLIGRSTEGDTKLSTIDDPSYADGVVKTKGSVYEDWITVLQGRD